ncbi:MAG: gliding motility protein GldN [Bacteroidales bacterium]|nr:gliding motility protein GldN [Bacteroidales bacterium]
MKKISLLVFSAVMLFISGNVFAQVVEEEENTSNWDSFYEPTNNNKAKKPFVYPYVRDADVVWQQRVWRLVDFREKMNQPFYYPVDAETDNQGRANLFTVIDRALTEGLIKVYEDDEFKVEANWEKLRAGAGKSQLQTFYRPSDDLDGEDISYDSLVTSGMAPEDVKSMRIKEDWYVDKQRSVRDVRIIGFSLVTAITREDGSSSPYPLGWIRYNDPAVRNLLANSEMYNPRNDVQRLSYDDVFVKRLFTSYITRTTNTYNRQISAYLTGLDALFESDAIEEEIFNREQDMWEY